MPASSLASSNESVKKAVRQIDQARRGLFECRLGTAMHRAKPVAEQRDDYFVIIKRVGRHRMARRNRWTWEIRRRSEPLGVKYNGNKYPTPQDAKLAGEAALKEFLHQLSQR
jgi:hypothetical protein